jgi:hypothetical protein
VDYEKLCKMLSASAEAHPRSQAELVFVRFQDAAILVGGIRVILSTSLRLLLVGCCLMYLILFDLFLFFSLVSLPLSSSLSFSLLPLSPPPLSSPLPISPLPPSQSAERGRPFLALASFTDPKATGQMGLDDLVHTCKVTRLICLFPVCCCCWSLRG